MSVQGLPLNQLRQEQNNWQGDPDAYTDRNGDSQQLQRKRELIAIGIGIELNENGRDDTELETDTETIPIPKTTTIVTLRWSER